MSVCQASLRFPSWPIKNTLTVNGDCQTLTNFLGALVNSKPCIPQRRSAPAWTEKVVFCIIGAVAVGLMVGAAVGSKMKEEEISKKLEGSGKTG